MQKEVIKKFALQNLEPLGFTQLGNSRTWLIDKDDYLVVLNFESSGFTKGTYIDVSLNFLWNPKDYISHDFFFGINPRITSFIEYQSEDQFEKDLNENSEVILKNVNQYLEIADLKKLSDLIEIKDVHFSSGSWLVFHKAVLEGLIGNNDVSKVLFDRLIKSDEISGILWKKERLDDSRKLLLSLNESKESFAKLVSQRVVQGRKMLKI